MTSHEIRIDRTKTLLEEPAGGHNRWHPDIRPVVRCQPGDEVVMETRDALDGQAGPGIPADALAAPNLDVVHPLTGPVYVEGAEPGDLLAVEILGIEPDSYGFTVQLPGFGFLRDEFPEPFKVDWDIADGWATSAGLPGVRIPGLHHDLVPWHAADHRRDVRMPPVMAGGRLLQQRLAPVDPDLMTGHDALPANRPQQALALPSGLYPAGSPGHRHGGIVRAHIGRVQPAGQLVMLANMPGW